MHEASLAEREGRVEEVHSGVHSFIMGQSGQLNLKLTATYKCVVHSFVHSFWYFIIRSAYTYTCGQRKIDIEHINIVNTHFCTVLPSENYLNAAVCTATIQQPVLPFAWAEKCKTEDIATFSLDLALMCASLHASLHFQYHSPEVSSRESRVITFLRLWILYLDLKSLLWYPAI